MPVESRFFLPVDFPARYESEDDDHRPDTAGPLFPATHAGCPSHAPTRVPVAAGRLMVKQGPPSGRFSAVIEPPCSSRMRAEIDSPRPVPCGLLVTKGRNSLSSISGGIPVPVSVTVRRTTPLSDRTASVV